MLHIELMHSCSSNMLHLYPVTLHVWSTLEINAYNVFYFPVSQDYRKRYHVGSEVIDNPQGIANYR